MSKTFKLNRQHYELLKPFEKILIKAATKKYLTIEEKNKAGDIKPIYKNITGIEVKRCSGCSGWAWLERIGKWYNDFKISHNE